MLQNIIIKNLKYQEKLNPNLKKFFNLKENKLIINFKLFSQQWKIIVKRIL